MQFVHCYAGVSGLVHGRVIPQDSPQAGHLAISTGPPSLCDQAACEGCHVAAGRPAILPLAA